MKWRNILSVVGSFFTSFGAIVILQAQDRTFWWIGMAMTILGPLLMGSRAMVATGQEVKQQIKQKD